MTPLIAQVGIDVTTHVVNHLIASDDATHGL
jgi:hypothetical protein